MRQDVPANGVLADADRRRRAIQALQEAREIARDPSVDPRVRELVERRLEGLGA